MRSEDRTLHALTDFGKSAHARAGARFHPDRAVRTRLGTRTRIRHETRGGFRGASSKKNRRTAADPHRAARGLHHSRSGAGMKRWPLRWKLALYAAALAVVATIAGAATTWALILSLDPQMKEVNRIGWDILFGMLGAIPTVLIVIAIGGRWVAKQALAPVEAISQAAARITLKNLDQRLPVPATADEMAELITVLNTMLDRLQRSFKQSVRFSAEASHHLKTPISVLRAGIEEILTDTETPAKQQTRAAALLHQIHQLTSIAENLLLLARADAGRLDLHCEQFDLSEVLRGMCEDASAMAEDEGLEVETKLPPKLPVVADRRAVSLIVQNLLENAIKYNEPEGSVSIYAQ